MLTGGMEFWNVGILEQWVQKGKHLILFDQNPPNPTFH
jgi:hypothetical protein